jgi:hypothetical protein
MDSAADGAALARRAIDGHTEITSRRSRQSAACDFGVSVDRPARPMAVAGIGS